MWMERRSQAYEDQRENISAQNNWNCVPEVSEGMSCAKLSKQNCVARMSGRGVRVWELHRGLP